MGCLGGTRESVISLGLGWMIVCIPLLMIKFRLVVHIILSLFYSNITYKSTVDDGISQILFGSCVDCFVKKWGSGSVLHIIFILISSNMTHKAQ